MQPANFHLLQAGMLVVVLICAGCSKEKSAAPPGEIVDEWGAKAPATDVVRTASSSDGTQLRLNLKSGDRFPLRKIVEQELIQDSITGSGNRIKTRLELLFAISILDKVGDRTKLSVRYERVKYSHRIGEETLMYDSTRPPQVVPVALRAYHDMVGDGFTFWIGAENQFVAVDNFTEFLDRCLRNIPESQRDNVLLGIEAGSGESGIANFIDNSIGLLPYSGEYHLGDTWERPGHIGRPVPMHVSNTYTLKQVDKDLATIDIRGKITPSTTMTAVDEKTGVRVTVTGGETKGTCTIFRESGLPQRSQVEQNINMTVMMTGALQFKQRKHVTTTIETYPVSSTSAPVRIGFSEQTSQPERRSRQRGTIRRVSGP